MRVVALCFCLLLACDSTQRVRLDGGGNGDGGGGGDGGGYGDGGGDNCSEQAKLVYVVDQNNKFSSFKPDLLQFTDIGTLNCPAGLLATPFSMAVDRSATAWVLFSDGQMFKVDTASLACTKASYTVQSGLANFGMGFATDTAGGTDETLFIAGGAAGAATTNATATFASLSMPALTVATRGTITGWPELTGTGDAKLWGFFPNTSPPKVAQINKTNGTDVTTFPAATLTGTPAAWAFAFWGGDFWIFLQRSTDLSTAVHKMSSAGALTTPIPTTGRTIVGAGVSTCAPITIN